MKYLIYDLWKIKFCFDIDYYKYYCNLMYFILNLIYVVFKNIWYLIYYRLYYINFKLFINSFILYVFFLLIRCWDILNLILFENICCKKFGYLLDIGILCD